MWSDALGLCPRRGACLTDPHLSTPGSKLPACRWRIEADLTEMAGDGCLTAWRLLSWQQGSGPPPAQELSTYWGSHRLTHAVSSSRRLGHCLPFVSCGPRASPSAPA